MVGEELRKTWGQSIVIENRAGAGGNLAGALVAKAKPDGYTLMIGSVGPLAVNASLYAKMPYDNIRDLAPITLIANVPNMLVVNPKAMPVASFAEFMTLAKANPGKFFYGSTGSGTSSHLSGELLGSLSGIRITHVPYKGAVALNDLLAGEQVHFMFATIPSAIQHVRAGKLKVLAVSSATRSPGLPDVPAIAELGFAGFDAGSWFGMVGPAGLPAEIAGKIQRDVAAVLRQTQVREKMIAQGADPVNPQLLFHELVDLSDRQASCLRMGRDDSANLRPGHERHLQRSRLRLEDDGPESATPEPAIVARNHVGDLERPVNLERVCTPLRVREVMVADEQKRRDARSAQALDAFRELPLVRLRRLARLVRVAGEDDGVDAVANRVVDQRVERVEEVLQAGVPGTIRERPPVTIHADVEVGEMDDPHARILRSPPPECEHMCDYCQPRQPTSRLKHQRSATR